MGVTISMTSELEELYSDLRFSSFENVFPAAAIVVQHHVETGSADLPRSTG